MDDLEDKGTESAISRFQKKLNELESGSSGDTDDDEVGPKISASDREDDDGKIPVVQTRMEKKRDRLKLKEAFEESQRTNHELSQRLARLEGAQSALMNQRGQIDRTDDRAPEQDDELDKIQEAHHQAYAALMNKERSGQATQADRDAFQRKARALEAQKYDVAVKRVLDQRGIQPYDPKVALHAVLQAENSDVYNNPRAQAYAKAYFEMQVARGEADSKELFERSMDAAREQFQLRPKGKPTDSRRRQLEGTRGGFSGGAPRDDEETITMTKPLRIMARAKYPGLSDEEAYVKWGKTVGPAFLAEVARSKKG